MGNTYEKSDNMSDSNKKFAKLIFTSVDGTEREIVCDQNNQDHMGMHKTMRSKANRENNYSSHFACVTREDLSFSLILSNFCPAVIFRAPNLSSNFSLIPLVVFAT